MKTIPRNGEDRLAFLFCINLPSTINEDPVSSPGYAFGEVYTTRMIVIMMTAIVICVFIDHPRLAMCCLFLQASVCTSVCSTMTVEILAP